MRALRKNRQKMYYSLFSKSEIVYERDDKGEIIYDEYTDKEGNVYQIPRDTGNVAPQYKKPIEFEAHISSDLNELHARSYGVDQSSIYSEIMCLKGQLPLKYGSKIWKDSEIGYKADGTVDETTSDYTVMGLLTEFISYDWFLLQRNNKEDK